VSADKVQPTAWQQQFAALNDFRQPGYIGKVPYLLILRWSTLLGIVLRSVLHRGEYDGRFYQLAASFAGALVLAIVMTRWPPDPGGIRWHRILAVILLDIVTISLAYLSTQRLQSDFFLFFFLPLIAAAEYLPALWNGMVFLATTAALLLIMLQLHSVDSTVRMTMQEAFFRVFIGREFFFLGLLGTAYFFFRLERHQRLCLERAADETQVLFSFSQGVDRLFRPEDLLQEAVETLVDTLRADWAIGVLLSDGDPPRILQHPPQTLPAASNLQHLLSAVGRGEDLRTLAKCEDGMVAEYLEVGKMTFALLAGGVLPGGALPQSAPTFITALTGPLLNGLRRSSLISSLRRINRETLRTFEFDRELNEILRYVTEDLHFEFGTITLKDEYRGVVETVRGRNVPPGLIRLSRYPLDARDIQTHVIAEGKTVLLTEYSDLLNREIFDSFEHCKLARVWVPLRCGPEVFGTIETGCVKERQQLHLTDEKVRALEQFAIEKGPVLRRLCPQTLLGLIADEAIGLVGADSASVHVFQCAEPMSQDELLKTSQEEIANHFGRLNPVLAAGAGKTTVEFIQAHPPRPNGMGWEAMAATLRQEHDSYRVIDNPDTLQNEGPAIYAAGVRAILAVPLRLAPNTIGVLYVHHWKPHAFTAQEIQLERVFAAQIEVAIQSHLLLRSTAGAVQDSRTLLEWLNVIQASSTLERAFPVLEELAQKLLLVADGDNVVLYQYLKDKGEFPSPPILKGTFLDRPAMETVIAPDHLVYRLLNEHLPKYYSDVCAQRPDVVVSRTGQRRRFVERENIRSCAILELRASPDDEIFGVLFVNYRHRCRFTPSEKNTMQVLAASAAAVIRTARFYEWLARRQQHLKSLGDIDKAIAEGAKSLDVDVILASILTGAAMISRAWAGAVLMRTPADILKTRATLPQRVSFECPIGSGAIGRCAQSGMSCQVLKLTPADGPMVRAESQSSMAIPFLDDGYVRGVLVLESQQEGAFSEDDVVVLRSLALQAVIALHMIDDRTKLEMERQRAVAISLVAKRIQNAEYPLELILYLILTGVTAGESLGFSRAMLFERDEHEPVLHGRCAIGKNTLQGAQAAWESLGDRSIEDALDSALEYFNSPGQRNEPFLQAVRSMEIPILRSEGVIAECVLQKTEFRSMRGEPDPFRARLEAATGASYQDIPFACIPLTGPRENIGVLVIDNRFQPRERDDIPDDMVGRVTAYAELAAMSIEAARMAEKTQTHTYEVLAHQLRNAIRLAAGSCRKLEPLATAAEDRSEFGKLKSSIDRAVQVGKRLQLYADLGRRRPLPIQPVVIAPEALLAKVLELARNFEVLGGTARGLTFEVDEPSFSQLRAMVIRTDLGFLQEALENLADNAVKYSYSGKKIVIAAEFPEDTGGMELYVENEGIPISIEEVEYLARRGWRGTKGASVSGEGSGIGLWVVDGIMTALGGKLKARATTPAGLTRIGLWFPAE
jgi:GAF domain-containing protein/signal transduction histidine kinase